MKEIILLLCILLSINSYSQEIKNIDIDFAIGGGATYGILGTKTVVGKNGNGLSIGLGTVYGKITYSIGAQIKHKYWFANLSYGVTGIHTQFENGVRVKEELMKGVVLLVGAQIDIWQEKLFFELAAGARSGSGIKVGGQNIEGDIVFSSAIGFGYRFGR